MNVIIKKTMVKPHQDVDNHTTIILSTGNKIVSYVSRPVAQTTDILALWWKLVSVKNKACIQTFLEQMKISMTMTNKHDNDKATLYGVKYINITKNKKKVQDKIDGEVLLKFMNKYLPLLETSQVFLLIAMLK